MQPTKALDPTGAGGGYRSDLPPLPREKRPYPRRGWQIGERLQGLGVIALGVVGMLVAYGIYSGALPAGLPEPPQPPGMIGRIPLINPVQCVIPVLMLGSVALVFVGCRQILDP